MLSQRQLFHKYLAQTSPFPMGVEIERAEGVYVYGTDGKKYLDIISGIGVSSLGHRHPNVVKAVKDQVDKYMHVMVYGEFVQSPQVKLAEALTNTLPENLNNVFLVNSGSEAIEGAMKLAKRFTGRHGIISCRNAYHGSTQGSLSLAGNEELKNAFRPLLAGVSSIDFGVEEELAKITNKTAAVIIETVQGEGGVRIASQKYWEAVRNRCDETGALLILDEIQCGFGRTGKFWAFEHYGIAPDILACAKGMGGGMPIGAFISSREIMFHLAHDPILGHISTFGGHPVNAAASLATLNTIINDELLQHVDQKAALIKKLLVHPSIKEIRHIGLMMAVQFESFEKTKAIVDQCTELGLITDWFLFCSDSLRIAPPLIISEKEIEEACKIILEAIELVEQDENER